MLLNTNSLPTAVPTVFISNPSVSADHDLLRRVKTFLSVAHRLGLRLLDVEARGGVVRLRGRVKSFYEKQLSVQLARRVAGVVRLIDEVIVNQPSVDGKQDVLTVTFQPKQIRS
jgi:hypothetical protein